MNRLVVTWLSAILITTSTFAQISDLGKGVFYAIEASGTASHGENAPLWLSSNRQGLGSIWSNSAYERAGVFRSTETDSLRQWKRGFGVDLVLNQHATSTLLVHQAYAEVAYKKITVTVGAKERTIDLRNNQLTTGGLSLGINASPIPQVLAEADDFSVPFTNHWWKLRGRIGFGMTTDGHWQQSWAATDTKHTNNILYHEKAIYLHFGREEVFPLTYEIGIQMFAQFGGTSYNITGRNYHDKTRPLQHPETLHAFWHAFWPMGSGGDVTDGTMINVAGNQLGSYNMALQWKGKDWHIRAYFERFFEDHSMLTVQYGIYDHLVGMDAALPKNRFVSNILLEHISTTDQAGPVYHDPTHNMPNAIAGIDNYYNHSQYAGWQHWGMSLGNPLITSPIYNGDHKLTFANNRIRAWHIGLNGQPTKELDWKLLLTFTKNWGTYYYPFSDVKNQQYYLAEVGYTPQRWPGWSARLAVGLDRGALIGNSTGAQLTLRKTGFITKP